MMVYNSVRLYKYCIHNGIIFLNNLKVKANRKGIRMWDEKLWRKKHEEKTSLILCRKWKGKLQNERC